MAAKSVRNRTDHLSPWLALWNAANADRDHRATDEAVTRTNQTLSDNPILQRLGRVIAAVALAAPVLMLAGMVCDRIGLPR